MSEIETFPLVDRRGQVVTAREYVRYLTWRYGPVDEQVLNELTIQWRAAVNRSLRGSAAGVVGDHIVVTYQDQGTVDQAKIDYMVYSARLSPVVVQAAKVMRTPPPLTVVRDIGIEKV